MNMQDFYTGHAFDAYEFFGAHTYFGGTHFAVWAPSAQHIAVETEIGTFDLHRTQSAVWECDAPGVQAGMVYQYWVRGANGQSVAHCDPYGTAMTLSYLVGQRYYPISYPLKDIFAYVALAAVLTVCMTLANNHLPALWAIVTNTLLVFVFLFYLVKKDLPLSSLPVVGKLFARHQGPSKTA